MVGVLMNRRFCSVFSESLPSLSALDVILKKNLKKFQKSALGTGKTTDFAEMCGKGPVRGLCCIGLLGHVAKVGSIKR